jgi:Do/DeqQ family serine protease
MNQTTSFLNFSKLVLAAVLGGTITLTLYKLFLEPTPINLPATENNKPVKLSSYFENLKNYTVPAGLNFVLAAEKVTPAVVHIKTYNNGFATTNSNFLDWFRDKEHENKGNENGEENDGEDPNENLQTSSGSGVIISQSGYIVTNNHVIEDADKVEVILDDKRSFEAKIIGRDASTDLALVKIDAKDLLYVDFGNSDEVKIGEWVLAVGNPFDLTSTVTAGIVSAKARNIHILRNKDQPAIEAFIQTDAAVNPGNSGGALVNLKGELIGINTAIATQTGSYSGYSFAVPVSLVKKVTDDLIKYGEVQRALLGITIQDVNAAFAKDKGLATVTGVWVSGVQKNSAADEAGIKIGDVIIAINETEISNVSALQETVARQRPGDKVKVTIERGSQIETLTMTLKNRDNTTDLVQSHFKPILLDNEGIEVIDLTEKEKNDLGVNYGVKIVKIYEGKFKTAKVKEGIVITHIDKVKIRSVAQLEHILQNRGGGLLIEGIDTTKKKVFYGIGF